MQIFVDVVGVRLLVRFECNYRLNLKTLSWTFTFVRFEVLQPKILTIFNANTLHNPKQHCQHTIYPFIEPRNSQPAFNTANSQRRHNTAQTKRPNRQPKI